MFGRDSNQRPRAPKVNTITTELKRILSNAFDMCKPGHTALYGLITAKTRQKMVSREADDVVSVDVEFRTSYSRFIDVAGRGEKLEWRQTRKEVLN